MKQKRLIRGVLAVALGFSLQACVINIPLFSETRGPLRLEKIVPADHFYTLDKILIIDLVGTVTAGDGGGFFSGPGMLVTLKDRLNEAEKDPSIKAVILRLDTPGGGVTASDLIYHEILEFKKRKQIPVVAMMEDLAASGGVYIAMAADEIYALPTTLTGSIGVIMILPGFEELSEKVGIKVNVVKSGRNKDLGSPWREMSEEDREFFQAMIDDMYERFLQVVLAGRGPKGLTRDALLEFADGRILQGHTAHELGLIDGVLYTEEVIERTKQLAGLKDAAIVSYEYPGGYRGNIYARSAPPPPKMQNLFGDLNLFKIDLGLGNPLRTDTRFLYMWVP